jgi:hypothetical protein
MLLIQFGGHLDSSHERTSNEQTQKLIVEYIIKSSGLKSVKKANGQVVICQQVDGKMLSFQFSEIEDVLQRHDGEGKAFLQVNFLSGKKILITDNLIGFKPASCHGLDMGKLPKVVTTPDLLSVVEAIEDTISSDGPTSEEIEVLKRVFESVLRGAESVGFDLTSERVWMHQFFIGNQKASA